MAGLRARRDRNGTNDQPLELTQSSAVSRMESEGDTEAGVGAQLLAKPIGVVEHAEGVACARVAGHVVAARLTCAA